MLCGIVGCMMQETELANKISRRVQERTYEMAALEEARRRKEEGDQEFLAQWRELSRNVILPIYNEVECHPACRLTEWITVTVKEGERCKVLSVSGSDLRVCVNLKRRRITVEGACVGKSDYYVSQLDAQSLRRAVWGFFEYAALGVHPVDFT